MLDVNPETVCCLIQSARSFHIKEEVVFPEEPLISSNEWALQALAEYAEDPMYIEFVTLIQDLEPDQQANLVALMWIGRGDYPPDEWETVLARAMSELTNRTAEYLISTPLLADYLQEAMEQLGYSCEV